MDDQGIIRQDIDAANARIADRKKTIESYNLSIQQLNEQNDCDAYRVKMLTSHLKGKT